MKRPGRALVLSLVLPVAVGAVAAGWGLHGRLGAAPAAAPAHPDLRAAVSTATPPARSGATFVWDGARHVDLLFGGRGATGQLDDTWAWDGARWHQLHPAASPPPLTVAAAAYDPGQARVVLVGREAPPAPGRGVPGLDLHTWTWDGATWHEEAGTIPGEELLGAPALAYDVQHRQLVLAGPGRGSTPPPLHPGAAPPPPPTSVPLRTWIWSSGRWTSAGAVAEVPATPYAMAWDSATRQVRLLAGPPGPMDPCGGPGGPSPSAVPSGIACGPGGAYRITACAPTVCPSAVQLAWDGGGWRSGRAAPYMGTITAGTLVTDPLAAGLAHTDGAVVWTWDGSSWTTHRGASHPAVLSPAVAADPDRHTLVVFGGRTFDPAATPRSAISSKTYTWDGSAWTDHGGELTALPDPSPGPPVAQVSPPTCGAPPPVAPPAVTTTALQGGVLRIDVALPAPVSESGAAGSCSAGHAVTVELVDAAGTPLEVSGNPVFTKTMATHETLLWSNWCGAGGVSLSVQLRPGGTAVRRLGAAPACSDRSQPSSLQLVSVPG